MKLYLLLFQVIFISGCSSVKTYHSDFKKSEKIEKNLRLKIVPLLENRNNYNILCNSNQLFSDSSIYSETRMLIDQIKHISRFKTIDVVTECSEVNASSRDTLLLPDKSSIILNRIQNDTIISSKYDYILYLRLSTIETDEFYKITDIYGNVQESSNKEFPDFDISMRRKYKSKTIYFSQIENLAFVYEDTRNGSIVFYRKRERLYFEDRKYLAFYLVRDTPFFTGSYIDFPAGGKQ